VVIDENNLASQATRIEDYLKRDIRLQNIMLLVFRLYRPYLARTLRYLHKVFAIGSKDYDQTILRGFLTSVVRKNSVTKQQLPTNDAARPALIVRAP